jgi:glucose/arabinose dehydrogenase
MRGLVVRLTRAVITSSLLLASTLHAQLTNPITTGPLQTNFARITTIPQTLVPPQGEPLDLMAIPGDPGNRLFVATHRGHIRLVKDNILQATSFLDIPGRGFPVLGGTGGDERGLLGLAFHPNFYAPQGTPGRGKFYTYTSEARGSFIPDFTHPELGDTAGDHHGVIREWTVNLNNPDVADATVAPRTLFRMTRPQGNHNGGALRFGPDNMLYIASGDGGGGNDNNGTALTTTDGHTNPNGNGQDITNVYGKVLRIDPTGNNSANGQYGVPAAVVPGGLPEIFAYGLRNPFRMSFDMPTGRLYLGDVGQGAREEVDIITAGSNFGWAHYEGTRANPIADRPVPPGFTYTAPIGEYTSADGHSVMGGFVYRGSVPEWANQYIFGDYNGNANLGRLFYMNPNGGTIFQFQHPNPNARLFGWGQDLDGEIYALFSSGAVEKLVARNAWNVDGGGSFGVAANWDGVIPGSANEARFLNRLSRGNTATITIDGDRTVNKLIISNPNRYIIAQGTGGTLRIGTPGVQVLRGSHLISAPFGWNTTSFAEIATNSSLELIGPIGFFGGPVIKSGEGTLILNNQLSSLSGSMLAQDGQVHLNANTGAPATPSTAAAARLSITVQRNTPGTSNTLVVLNADQDLRQLRSQFNDPNLQGIDLNSPTTPGAFRSVRIYPFDINSELANLSSAIAYARTHPGDGIYDSSLALTGNRATMRIGLAPKTDAFGAQHILMRPTSEGDLNLDGMTTISDFLTLASNFGQTNALWHLGDLNHDRQVSIADFLSMAANMNSTYSGEIFPIAPAEQKMLNDFYAANVPEPAGLLAVFLGAVILFNRLGHRPLRRTA